MGDLQRTTLPGSLVVMGKRLMLQAAMGIQRVRAYPGRGSPVVPVRETMLDLQKTMGNLGGPPGRGPLVFPGCGSPVVRSNALRSYHGIVQTVAVKVASRGPQLRQVTCFAGFAANTSS